MESGGSPLKRKAFEFQLHYPPCDPAFLAVVDAPVLFNADDVTSGKVKDATIRHIGWHVLHLPEEWFFSQKSRELTERVCQSMQCTIQYLAYRMKKLQAELKNAGQDVEKIREERNEAFEELVDLREVVARMKQRYEAHGQGRHAKGAAAPDRLMAVDEAEPSFMCSFCGNCYPSYSSLGSHVRKRHRRGERHAAMTATSAATQKKLGEGNNLTNDVLRREVTSLRKEVVSLREAMTAEKEKRQLDATLSFFSPMGIAAMPAHHLPSPPLHGRDMSHLSPRLQEEEKRKMDALQDELRVTKSRLQKMEKVIYRQAREIEGGHGRCTHELESGTVEETPLKNAVPVPTSAKSKELARFASGSSLHSNNCYPLRMADTHETVKKEVSIEKERDLVSRRMEVLEPNYEATLPPDQNLAVLSGHSSSASRSAITPVSPSSREGSAPSLSVDELRPELSESPRQHSKLTASVGKLSVRSASEASKVSVAAKNNVPFLEVHPSQAAGDSGSGFNSINLGKVGVVDDGDLHRILAHQTGPTSHLRAAETQSLMNNEEKALDENNADLFGDQNKGLVVSSSLRGFSENSVPNLNGLNSLQEMNFGYSFDSYMSPLRSSAYGEAPVNKRTLSGLTSNSFRSRAEEGVESHAGAFAGEMPREEEQHAQEERIAVDPKKNSVESVTSEKGKKWKKLLLSRLFTKRKK
ncbi:zinc finger protein, putative [Trypanosoma cruzi marinkellei]|uniref:Zinc finger protein, putative n=1 Tax=Trypanosoma cruzi marinkellei TaxID=85056 RepID=K2NS43_TRYCR|nr:zinc finger protein, putative [Trypanosoma cruzi marinkellei]